jgi:hypothetical protein
MLLKNGRQIFVAEGLDTILIKRSDLPDDNLITLGNQSRCQSGSRTDRNDPSRNRNMALLRHNRPCSSPEIAKARE